MKSFFTKNKINKTNKRGFTLVESLVAITVLLLASTSAFTIAQQGLSASYFARDRITAYYLGKEALEFIKNKRDQNSITGQPWLAGITDNHGGVLCGSEHSNLPCGVDILNDTVKSCSAPGGCDLFVDQNGFYFHSSFSGQTPQKFKREVLVTEIQPNIEAKVTVTVTWTQGLSSHTLVINDTILNWLP